MQVARIVLQLKTVSLLLALASVCTGLLCYECSNARDDQHCRQKGKVVVCSESQQSCQTTERFNHLSGPRKISKRCKQAKACENNHKQNALTAKQRRLAKTKYNVASLPQCNYFPHVSVCRCCCVDNLCNFDTDTCTGVTNRGLLQERNRTPKCPKLGRLKNGVMTCDNGRKAGSNCRFRCDTFHDMKGPSSIYCQQIKKRARWTGDKPCCAKPCPPHGSMDLIIGVDMSVGSEEDWVTTKALVKSVISLFVLGKGESRIGVVTFNDKVGKDREIYLSSYNKTESLVEAVDALPYRRDIGGTRTGQLLDHVSEVSFSPARGNRPSVRDLFILISAGIPMKEKGDPEITAKLMRDNGVQVIVVGIGRNADYRQLRKTAATSDSIIEIRGGVDVAADNNFKDEIIKILCGNICEEQG